MGDFRTSSYLQEALDDLTQTAPEVNDAIPAAVVEHLGRWLLESFEGLSNDALESINRILTEDPDFCEFFIDDYLARHLVGDIPKLVKRLLRFEMISASAPPTGPVNAYLREAVRCYVYGLNQGAVTLARAAIEQGLRERVPFAAQNRWKLDELIDAATRFAVLTAVHAQMATDVQRLGNEVLHARPCDSDQACEALTKARAVLEELFAVPGARQRGDG